MQKTLTIPYPIVPNKEAYSTCNFEKLKIGKHYLVWWFGGILREQKHRSIQTTFQVIFREVIEKNEHSTVVGEFVTEYLSVQPYLTSFRIGYIWQRTKYHSTVVDEMINLPVFSLTTSFSHSDLTKFSLFTECLAIFFNHTFNHFFQRAIQAHNQVQIIHNSATDFHFS